MEHLNVQKSRRKWLMNNERDILDIFSMPKQNSRNSLMTHRKSNFVMVKYRFKTSFIDLKYPYLFIFYAMYFIYHTFENFIDSGL